MTHVFDRLPRAELRPFVQRFLSVEFPAVHADSHLPDTGSVAAFSLRGRCRLDHDRWAPRAAFTGLRETLRHHEHVEGHAVLLVSFTPVGAAAFLRTPLEAFSGTTTDLADILGCPGEIEALHEKFSLTKDRGQHIDALENFLLARIGPSAPDPLVRAAIDWMERAKGAGRIEHLTRYIGLSQSALERRFRRVVGISPKKFGSLLRLRRALALRTAGANFTAVAHEAGYFDQSHFINEFRRVTGHAPEAFFRQEPGV